MSRKYILFYILVLPLLSGCVSDGMMIKESEQLNGSSNVVITNSKFDLLNARNLTSKNSKEEVLKILGDPVKVELNESERSFHYCKKNDSFEYYDFVIISLKDDMFSGLTEYYLRPEEFDANNGSDCKNQVLSEKAIAILDKKRNLKSDEMQKQLYKMHADRSDEYHKRIDRQYAQELKDQSKHLSAIKKVLLKLKYEKGYENTEELVLNRWSSDNEGRKFLYENPEYIEFLHADLNSGFYEVIKPRMTEIQQQGYGFMGKSQASLYAEARKELDEHEYLEAKKAEEEDEFRNVLNYVEQNEAVYRTKLKWSIETKGNKNLELLSAKKGSEAAKKLGTEIKYLNAEINDLTFWINTLDKKKERERNAEKKELLAAEEAYRKQISEYAERKAKAAERANSQASLQSLNNQIQGMNDRMWNSINSMNNMYQPNRKKTGKYFVQPLGGSNYFIKEW